MRSLSDTVDRLANFRAMARRPASPGPRPGLAPLSPFGANPGGLSGWLHLPPGLPEGAPLVVALHGCTQTAGEYGHGAGWCSLADRLGFAVLLPEQMQGNNAHRCFNWFSPADTNRGLGEAASIAQMVQHATAAHRLNPRRVFVTGLSAGGAMTSVMLATYPELFAGGAIIAGLPYRCASSMPEAFDRMRGHGLPASGKLQALLPSGHDGPWPTLSVWHGTADHTVAAANATAIVAQWRLAHGVSAEPTTLETGAGYRRLAWCDAAGAERIEQYLVAGMGHGTPIDAAGRQPGSGSPAPFMLDAGLSSTRHIARFWGLLQAAEYNEQAGRDAPQPPPSHQGGHESLHSAGLMERVEGVIDKALRAAGLR